MLQEAPQFHMLVGIPGSGKTTWSSEKTDCVILSSDTIRQEMGLGFAQEDHTKLFAEITRRIIQHLQNKDNVIFDATNLNRKRRMALIKLINSDHKIGIVHTICELFIAPPEVCIKRCSQRTGQPFVSPDVIHRMIKNFQVPSKYEGFDKINVHYSDDGLTYVFDTKDFGERQIKKTTAIDLNNYISTMSFPGQNREPVMNTNDVKLLAELMRKGIVKWDV